MLNVILVSLIIAEHFTLTSHLKLPHVFPLILLCTSHLTLTDVFPLISLCTSLLTLPHVFPLVVTLPKVTSFLHTPVTHVNCLWLSLQLK